jgi:formylglycine-generating enzyme required for sulfatase activity
MKYLRRIAGLGLLPVLFAACFGSTGKGPEGGFDIPLKYVPAGSFQRDGASANVSVISTGYWMGETEITQELFRAVMGKNPGYFNGSIGRGRAAGEIQKQRPVEYVNWYHAIAFCNKLSIANGKDPVYSVSGVDWVKLSYRDIPVRSHNAWNAVVWDKTRNGYRLPTEMEWMWAAMGADTSEQPNTMGYAKAFAGSDGNNGIDDYAWYDANSGAKTHEAGKKRANELGLRDMSGNVWELCWDWYDDPVPGGEQTDYGGAAWGTYRVFRGGSWYGRASYCAAAYRDGIIPDHRGQDIGFRVVCP